MWHPKRGFLRVQTRRTREEEDGGGLGCRAGGTSRVYPPGRTTHPTDIALGSWMRSKGRWLVHFPGAPMGLQSLGGHTCGPCAGTEPLASWWQLEHRLAGSGQRKRPVPVTVPKKGSGRGSPGPARRLGTDGGGHLSPCIPTGPETLTQAALVRPGPPRSRFLPLIAGTQSPGCPLGLVWVGWHF